MNCRVLVSSVGAPVGRATSGRATTAGTAGSTARSRRRSPGSATSMSPARQRHASTSRSSRSPTSNAARSETRSSRPPSSSPQRSRTSRPLTAWPGSSSMQGRSPRGHRHRQLVRTLPPPSSTPSPTSLRGQRPADRSGRRWRPQPRVACHPLSRGLYLCSPLGPHLVDVQRWPEGGQARRLRVTEVDARRRRPGGQPEVAAHPCRQPCVAVGLEAEVGELAWLRRVPRLGVQVQGLPQQRRERTPPVHLESTTQPGATALSRHADVGDRADRRRRGGGCYAMPRPSVVFSPVDSRHVVTRG